MRIAIVAGLLLAASPALAQDGFTQQDRALLTELRVRLEEMDRRFEEFRLSMDRRFEQGDRRFEDVHSQLSYLRQDMNKRFEQMLHFFYILAGIFTSMVVAVIGFAYWDRRTIIREARREAIEFIEKEGVLRRLLDAVRTLAQEDPRLASVLKRYNLL